MNFTEALAVLRKDEEEDRNWRSARSKLTELLTACLAADAELAGKAAQSQSLDQQIERKQAELGHVEEHVRQTTDIELQRRRNEMTVELKGLADQITADQARAHTAKEAADREEERLRVMRDGIGKLGLTPLVDRP
jgi:hypothetical protein